MRSLVLALVLVPALAAADPPKLTLDQVIAKAVASQRVEMAQADLDASVAQLGEVEAAMFPRVKGTAFGTISPEIHCVNIDVCTVTEPRHFSFQFSGVFGGAQLDITQPLYTFGKISHARNAARDGVNARLALANEAAGDAASDAARAYWGLKLSRELGYMLDDGIETIAKAQADFEQRKDATIQDKQRLLVLLAEAKAQRADAAQAEAQALAGLRALVNIPDADIDDSELLPVERELMDPSQLEDAAKQRPQRVAASFGAKAYSELAKYQAAYYYPDFALVGSAFISRAQGVDDPPSAFWNDPYNRSGAGLVLALQWQLEPWTVQARTERARAEAHRMKAQSDLAALGASYDAQTAAADARTARDKLAATTDGEKAARAWLASVLQNEAIGTAEAKDLADAYIAWFQMKARWAQAVFQWNVAVVRVGRATGEFRASDSRLR
jgi:outer membrane protein TolC